MFKLTPHKQHAQEQANTTSSKQNQQLPLPKYQAKQRCFTGEGRRGRSNHIRHQPIRTLKTSKIEHMPQSHSFEKDSAIRRAQSHNKSNRHLQPNYSKYQLKIKPNKLPINNLTRIILIDWLIQLSLQLHISKQALYQAIHYLDKLTSHTSTPKHHYQSLGVACLWLSHKIDSRIPLSYATAESAVQRVSDEQWFKEAELMIMQKLQYKLNPLTIYAEVRMVVAGFEKYFRKELEVIVVWPIQKDRILWICEGVTMENKYSEFAQPLLAVSVLFLVGSQLAKQNYIKEKRLVSFCLKLLNLTNFQLLQKCTELISHWSTHTCQCSHPFSPSIPHFQLKKLASK